MISLKLWKGLGSQDTYSICTLIASEVKKMQKISEKNNFRIMKKPHAHLQTNIKMCVKIQKDQPKTVWGVALTRKHENVTDRQTYRLQEKQCLPNPLGGDMVKIIGQNYKGLRPLNERSQKISNMQGPLKCTLLRHSLSVIKAKWPEGNKSAKETNTQQTICQLLHYTDSP